MSTTRCVFDCHGRAQQLTALLGSGGEGEVYTLAQRPELAVKCYHPEVLAKHQRALQAKVEAQIVLYPKLKHLPLAWPRLSVFDEQRMWIGYAMSRAQGVPIRHLEHPALQQKSFPAMGRTQICAWLLRLLQVVNELHLHGVVLGDINLSNILLEPGTADGLWLIDCDSMQITSVTGTRFPCLVGTAEFTAPEHQNKDFAKVQRTPQSDAYSLAILMFQCFMLGRHPFDQIDGTAPVENMLRGHFPYGKNGVRPGSSGGIPPGPWYLLWSWLSYGIKDGFCTTFREGSHDPVKRPSLTQWIELLSKCSHALGNPMYGLVDTLRSAQPKLAHTPCCAP